ncbi:MAG: polysaccharide pyruvyl transferase family protein [Chitinophagaceae bacterium]|nr:polysaccharide pyruvyl transferase family protein [Chitinophagaceae bacterium]
MERRKFIQQTSLLALATLAGSVHAAAANKKKPVILVVSGWQDVNIGDITHTPGLLTLLKQKLPNAKVILWKKSDSEQVDNMLHKYFPDLRIVHGKFDKSFTLQSEELKQVFLEADFFIHGSGPSVVGADNIRCWRHHTKKSYGIFGVTIQEIPNDLKELLLQASFIFTRETASVDVLRKNGLAGDHISFAPDATFVLDINDNKKANAFLNENRLEARKFICAIPRLRYTPYYKWASHAGWTDQRIKEVEAVNEKYKETDHAKLREAMIAWVRKTGNKVLVCPEMTYQVDIMEELLIDPLPADVKPFVIKRGYWLPDEAASVYAKAHTILSFECHSPIIAAANGTPAFYLRQPTDTIKGQMYYDLGFENWVFEIDNTGGGQIADKLMQVYDNYPVALQTVDKAIEMVNKRYDLSFDFIKKNYKIFS